jgi:biotin transport system substrate-specific component
MTETIQAPRLTGTRIARNVAVAIAGAALMTLAAKTQVPFWPVPMTLHIVAVMGFAVLLGPRMATGIFITYLAAGAAGLPVFAGSPERGIGLAYMMGPTGGYLAGFLMACWLVGALAAGRGIIGCFGAMLAGLSLIYACGIAWLALFVPADTLLAVGVFPFVLGDLVKIAVVAAGTTLLSRTRLNMPGFGK